MAKSAVLNVSVLVDAAKAATELNQTAQSFEKFGKKLTSAVISAVAIGGVTALAKTVVSAASDMQQAMGGTDKVFGSSADEIHAWAADTTDSIRLPALAVEKYATLIKTQLAATGQPMSALVTQTKALIQVGADLSAVTGADLADSIAAVKSALAGEYDPIQNLGVAMSGASVQAQALALAHGDTTAAASDAIVMQARVAEIMQKSAFATGAAAEESDTFQARMDSLTEKTQNLAATVGGPLLDALSGIVGHITDAASGAETLGLGLGTMLGFVLQLPGPIQAIVLGLVAFTAISATWGTKVAGAFTSFISTVTSATSSVGGLKSALAGIGPALLGGGILLGIGAVIAAIAIAVGRVADAAKKGKDELSGYVDALVASGNASTDATAAAFQSALLTSDAYKELVKDGFSAAEAVKILTGTQEEWRAVAGGSLGTIHDLNRDTMALVDGFIDANGEAGKLAQAQIDGAAAMDSNSAATAANAEALAAEQKATEDAAAEQKKLADALKAAQAVAEATIANQAMVSMKSAADDAQRAVDFLSLTLDKMTGGTRSLEAAQAGLNSSLTGIADAFKAVDGASALDRDALVAWNVTALTQNEAGQKAYDSLVQVRSGYEQTVGAAYSSAAAAGDNNAALAEAQSTADYAYNSFIAQAGAMGISAEQAATLASHLGILNAQQLDPKVFQLIAEDQDARAKVAALQAQGIDPKNIVVTAQTDAATGAVTQAIAVIDASGATIPVEAAPAPAAAAIEDVAGASYQATVKAGADTSKAAGDIKATAGEAYKTTITAGANMAQAESQIAATVNQARNITIQVTANTSPANILISALINEAHNKTVAVTANTSSFDQSMRDITTRSYTATVTVTANTSAAAAAIAAVPRSVSVPAPPTAPTLRGATGPAGQSTQVAAVTYNVTVQGHLQDPDGLARALDRVQTARARRSTTVIAR